jgi:hypothetical protein
VARRSKPPADQADPQLDHLELQEALVLWGLYTRQEMVWMVVTPADTGRPYAYLRHKVWIGTPPRMSMATFIRCQLDGLIEDDPQPGSPYEYRVTEKGLAMIQATVTTPDTSTGP